MKNAKRRNIIGLSIIVVLMAITFFILLKGNNLPIIIETVKTAKLAYILIAVLMMIIYLFLGGFYLKIILNSLNVKSTIIKCFIYQCCETYFSGITPLSLGGQPSEMYYMSKDGINVTSSSMAMLFMGIVAKLTTVILCFILILFNTKFIFNNGTTFTIGFIFGIILNIILIIVFLMLLFSPKLIKKWGIKLLKLLGKIKVLKESNKIIGKFEEMIVDYKKSSNHLKKNKIVFIKVLIIAFVQRICFFSISFFIYKSFGLSNSSFMIIMLIQISTIIITDSLPLPGGVGASEAIFLNLYMKIYSENMIMPAMLLTRGINFYFSLIFTGVVVLINHIRVLKKKKINIKL